MCRHIVISLHHIVRYYLISDAIFGKNTEYKMCVFIFSIIFVWKCSHSKRIQRDIVINVNANTLYSCRILIELEFSRQIFTKAQMSRLIKIRPLEAESFYAGKRAGVGGGRTNGRTERQTDRTKLTVAFRNFENAPKNEFYILAQRAMETNTGIEYVLFTQSLHVTKIKLSFPGKGNQVVRRRYRRGHSVSRY